MTSAGDRNAERFDPREASAWRTRLGTGDGGWPAAREDALVERILAETSRVPAGWRGDLRLVGRFVRDRLRSSRGLRAAVAASLVVHLAAVPALAWFLWPEPELPATRLLVELPETLPVEELAEPERPMGSGPLGLEALEEWGAGGLGTDAETAAAENARRRGRFLLMTVGPPPEFDGEGQPPAVRWLARRSRIAAEGLPADRGAAAWSSAGSLERVLWAEALLDAYVLRKELPAWTERVWDELAFLARGVDPPGDLARMALERAAAYGLCGGPFVGASDGRPWTAAWAQAVAGQLESRGELTVAARDWLAACVSSSRQ